MEHNELFLNFLEKLWRQDLLIVKIHYWCCCSQLIRGFMLCMFYFYFLRGGIARNCSLSKIFLWLLSWQKTESSVFMVNSWISWPVPINSDLFVWAKAKQFMYSAIHTLLSRLLLIVQNWLLFWWLASWYQCFTEVPPSPLPMALPFTSLCPSTALHDPALPVACGMTGIRGIMILLGWK